MATTSLGIPQYAQTDSADVATKLNAISQATNDLLVAKVDTPGASPTAGAIVKSGTFTVKMTNVAAVSINVTFAAAFSAPPVITCDIQPFTNNTPLDWGITGRTNAGFTLYVRTVSGSAVTTSGLLGQYIAVGLA